jgi:hypothetical protein
LALYLPRLTVLVTIEADRPGAWFPGSLGPYLTCFPAIELSRDFKLAKVPGNPIKSSFCFGVFWRVIFKKSICASRQPNHVKTLAEWPQYTTKRKLQLIGLSARRPQGRVMQPFFDPKIAPRYRVFDRLPESAPGAHRGVVTRHSGQIRVFGPI